MKIDNSVILITGGSSGIGKSMAEYFSQLGGIVYICDIQEDLGKKVETESGGKIKFIKCDVSNEEDVRNLVDRIFLERGRIDVCINNAGVGGDMEDPNDDMKKTISAFNKIFNINVFGVFLVSKYVAEIMIKTADSNKECNGCIINISSIMGLQGIRGLTTYSASKGAVIGMTMPMARDLGKYKIRVNSVCPGLVPTPLSENLKPFLSIILNKTPIKRLGKPIEIALACEGIIKNDFINGSIIKVDGGIIAHF